MPAPNAVPGHDAPLVDNRADVLVVDDNRSNLLAVQAALEDLHAHVVTATSGQEALRLLLTWDFALILLDVQMPTLDGFQTARLIRQRNRSRGTPIIFITAHSTDHADILQAYALGAVDFLFKPVVGEVLRAKASVFVHLHLQQLELARQATLIQEHERQAHQQQLESERRAWEQAEWQRRIQEQERAAAELSRKAAELALNVAERERAEAALTQINEKLAEADRRKDEFLAVLAHELRNPLAPMITALEIIRFMLPNETDARALRALETTQRQVEQLSRLVDDLLDISRINNGKIELRLTVSSVGRLIERAIDASSPQLESRQHELTVSIPEPAYIRADTVRLVQVLSNLLNNAARYTDPGGHIEVRVDVDEFGLNIRVRDNGRGIAPDQVDRIFEMFSQQHQGEGLGLGLTLVRQLVELHGGSVSAKSDGPGHGSEFTVHLPPRCLAAAEGESVATKADPEPEAASLDVVVIDDNPDIRATTQQLFELWGHRVTCAENGLVGLELVLKVRPALVLVDIDMPEMNGYELASALRTRAPDLNARLVALSGYGQAKDRQRAFEAGFDEHLTKPASVADLRRLLARGRTAESSPPLVDT